VSEPRTTLLALLLVLPLPAAAVSLPPDSNVSPSGAAPPVGAVIDQGIVPFALAGGEGGGGTATGSIAWEAILESEGLIRFEFVVANDVQSSTDVGELSTSSYAGYAVDADVDGSSAGDAEPIAIGRNQPGARVSFFFGGAEVIGIAPGESSKTLYVRTNASAFDTLGAFRVRSGPLSANITDVGPQPVPEPATALGGVAAWLALLALRRRG
jgi:hypothetical protein